MKKASDGGSLPFHILVTSYNGADYLSRALESALGQRYPNLTVLIYDDGSSQAALRVARRLADGERVRLTEGGTNRGVAFARRKLLSLSRDLDPKASFLWLDQDDRLMSPDSVGAVAAQMQKTQADICLYAFSLDWENDSEDLKANAKGLMKDKEAHEILLARIAETEGQVVSFDMFPDLMTATSLGCVKAYRGAMKARWPSLSEGHLFEDFPPMALLLEANGVTALSAACPVAAFLRRVASSTGARKPCHFTEDFAAQMRCFLEATRGMDEARRAAAAAFVRRKAAQYKETLAALIAAGRAGFDEGTMADFQKVLVGLI